MWTVCITSISHVLKLNGYGGRQAKVNEKRLCFKGWETLVNSLTDLLGLTAEVYKLVATKDGYYDVYEWGNDKPVGKTYLKKGDTWKIGETTNFRTRKNGTEIQNRYTKKWLNKNNLEYRRLQYSPNKSAKVSFQNYETSRTKKFEKRFWKKTSGNKCFH